MDRTYATGASGSAPTAPASPSTGYPTAGNPGTGTPATKPGPYWYHQITEELMTVIAAAGITPAQGTLSQLASAIQSGKLFSLAAGGTADVLTASFAPAVVSLVNGMLLSVRASLANATATPTFTPASGVVTAKAIVKGAGAALVAGDIAGAGHWLELQYDQTLDKWVLMNPANGVVVQANSAVQGSFKNLKLSTTGLNANVAITCDELVLENSSNAYLVARSLAPTFPTGGSGVWNGSTQYLDTGGTWSASTWYSVWIIGTPGGGLSGLFSLSATAPTMPGGYTYKARVGWIRTDGSGNKYPLAIKQLGRCVTYLVASGSNVTAMPIMVSGNQGNPLTPTYVSVSTATFIPTTAKSVDVVLRSGNSSTAIVAPNNQYGGANSITNPPPVMDTVSATTFGASKKASILLESANIYYAESGSATDSLLLCSGWEDSL